MCTCVVFWTHTTGIHVEWREFVYFALVAHTSIWSRAKYIFCRLVGSSLKSELNGLFWPQITTVDNLFWFGVDVYLLKHYAIRFHMLQCVFCFYDYVKRACMCRHFYLWCEVGHFFTCGAWCRRVSVFLQFKKNLYLDLNLF